MILTFIKILKKVTETLKSHFSPVTALAVVMSPCFTQMITPRQAGTHNCAFFSFKQKPGSRADTNDAKCVVTGRWTDAEGHMN